MSVYIKRHLNSVSLELGGKWHGCFVEKYLVSHLETIWCAFYCKSISPALETGLRWPCLSWSRHLCLRLHSGSDVDDRKDEATLRHSSDNTTEGAESPGESLSSPSGNIPARLTVANCGNVNRPVYGNQLFATDIIYKHKNILINDSQKYLGPKIFY